MQSLALEAGWESRPIVLPGSQTLPAFRRLRSPSARRIYISSGIHGDEPAGPLALLRLFQENNWPGDCSLWVVPCLNPHGFVLNCRENETGIDLNRDYRFPKTDLAKAHIRWLDDCPQFELTLLLHEDWESRGFYVYELNPDHHPSFAPSILDAVRPVCPIDTSPLIEGRPARDGLICANIDLLQRPDWPEAFYLIHHKTRMSYTLEAPSDYPMFARVDALVAGVRGALRQASAASPSPAS